MAKRPHRSSHLDEFSLRRIERLLEQPRGRAIVLVNLARRLRALAGAADQNLDQFAADQLRRLGRDDDDAEIRLWMVRALMIIGAEDARQILRPLYAALAHQERRTAGRGA